MRDKLKILFNVIIPTLVIVFFYGCKKDNKVIGTEVQPASDILNFSISDTSVIYSHTIKHDSIASFNDRYKFLGSVHDPYFGRTDVGLYLNLNIPNGVVGTDYGDDATLVSAEIILKVQEDLKFAGNNTVSLTYSVFPVSTSLSKSTVYYTNNNKLHNTNSVLANVIASISQINGKTVLRIPIDFNYASAMLTNKFYLDNNTIFQSTYKGFYITAQGSNLNPVNTTGLISKYDTDDALSGLYLYYQNGIPSASKENKTAYFSFSGTESVRYNTVNYRAAELSPASALYQQIILKDTIAGKDNLFLKGLGGTKIKFYIPGLKNYADSFPVAVNRAEVIFHLDPLFTNAGSQFLVPPKLSLLAMAANSYEVFALDQLNLTDLARYDGIYDYTHNRYVFNIARHVQAIMRGSIPNYGFYLVVADPTPVLTPRRDIFMERIILAGSNHPTLKPKLTLSYVKLRNDKK